MSALRRETGRQGACWGQRRGVAEPVSLRGTAFACTAPEVSELKASGIKVLFSGILHLVRFMLFMQKPRDS